jgi:uncharacterized protein (DUF362 family)
LNTGEPALIELGMGEHDPVTVIHDAVFGVVGDGRQLQGRVREAGAAIAIAPATAANVITSQPCSLAITQLERPAVNLLVSPRCDR